MRCSAQVSELLQTHPCFDEAASLRFGRMHLPVAPRCNLGCRYCERGIGDRARQMGGPGTAKRLLSPAEAEDLVGQVRQRGWTLRVVGIAGPGEPLANPATFETLGRLSRRYPELILCLSTNGLELEPALPSLRRLGLRSISITISATRSETAARLYAWAELEGERIEGQVAAAEVLARQWRGLAAAARAGLLVKVNSVLIPDITEGEMESVARRAAELGAHRHNVLPLLPRGRMRHLRRPTREEIEGVRDRCERWVPQFRACLQCAADVVVAPRGRKGEPLCEPTH